MNIEYFQFENDFVEPNIRCIPMIVRFKLDACGIKLKLSEWSRMNKEEREMLARLPIDTRDQLLDYRVYLKGLILMRTGNNATELVDVPTDAWAITKKIPEELTNKLNQFNQSIS